MTVMKKIVFILLSLFLFSSCSSDDNTTSIEKFSLINVSGGFAGINENFAKEEITWTFNVENSTLIIKKNIQNTFSGLSEGTYTYSFENSNNKQYIFINDIEIGSVLSQENGMIINENEQSSGSGADRFVYELEK